MTDRFQGESDPIATNPILRGVDLAMDRLVRADCFTERTLRVLDELRAEVLAAEQAHTPTDRHVDHHDDAPTDEARAIIRQVREFATKERDSIRGRYGAGSATYAGYANACDDILSILDGDPSAHDRDRDGICRRCGHGLTGETPCQPQGEPTTITVPFGGRYEITTYGWRLIERAVQDGEV